MVFDLVNPHIHLYHFLHYLRLSPLSGPFLVVRLFPDALSFGYDKGWEDIFQAYLPRFLFQWSHRPSAMGQLHTRPTGTTRPDIVSLSCAVYSHG
jgi:hypothetical protein